ncbi:MAG: dTMP kinase [Candidatus Eisenbacteria bacterium]|uniref:Thymidylate kinase n=1 Tax=Eiseniibacteriota bacterium TaxID=2212470 RepID=A0A938BPW0_UNCEI|nr:dTMP kinase [Candidatus Eisenbacteria bacterium]
MSRGSGGGARGLFLAFEGIEGCGKSTQIERLVAFLARRGRSSLVSREPGGTPLGEALRALLLDPAGRDLDGLTELFLLEAARRAHVERVIRPALRGGRVVVADRFADSSVAYQGGGRGLDVALVERLNELATGGLAPDLTLLLDLEVEVGLSRVARRERRRDRMERERVEFHHRVREAYRALAARRGDRYRLLDASLPADALALEIEACVGPLL